MRINTVRARPVTHAGGRAQHTNAEQQLRRSVMACMLWENEFYEDGQSIADRIAALVPQVPFNRVAEIAIDAREKSKLRHVPLLILRESLRHFHTRDVGDTIARVIQRPDECTELIAMVWKDIPAGQKRKLPNQLKLGIARAIQKFDAYQLSKWDRDSTDVKLRDAVFLCHPRARNAEVGINLAKMVNKDYIPEKVAAMYEIPQRPVGLLAAKTWENQLSEKGKERAVLLSAGEITAEEVTAKAKEDKKSVFEDMLSDNKLGAMALLRNLRGMQEAGVDPKLIRDGLARMKTNRVLPFRFISAAKHAPRLEPQLEEAMFRSIQEMPPLEGRTVILVDVSGSMQQPVSGKSEVTRADAAAGLAMLVRELSRDCVVLAFSDFMGEVAPRRGFALRDALRQLMRPAATYLGKAVTAINQDLGDYDRLIVITDEQSHDRVPAPKGKGYVINVGSYRNGIGYGAWLHIDGWSEAVLDYIREFEKAEA